MKLAFTTEYDGSAFSGFQRQKNAPSVQQNIEEALEKILPHQLKDFTELFEVMDGKTVCIRLLDPPLHEFLPQADEAAEVAKDLGVDLEVKKIAWDGLIPALQSNEIDVIIAGMSPTNERRQTIDFSDPYYRDEPTMSVVVNKNTKFVGAKELKDLDGAKISAQLGTLHVDLLDQINGESANPLPDYSALIQATVSGTIDGYIAEYVVAEEQAKQNKNLSLITFPQGKGFVMDENEITSAIGMKKDSGDFLKAINASLAKISGDERESLMKEATSRSEA